MTLLRDDPQLYEHFRAGRAEALGRVYCHYIALVAKIMRVGFILRDGRRVLGASGEAQEDLLQETFTRAFREAARAAYDGKRPYQPYLCTIARNLLVDWSRKRGREVPTDDIGDEAETAQEDDGVAAWAPPEVMEQVNAYITGLTPELRAVYEQRYVHCVSQVEAADRLGLTRQRVRTLEQKLRDGLRAQLG